MHPAEGFSRIFTVTQQPDIERFMRYIAPALEDPQSWLQANRPPTAAQHTPSQQHSAAQHMSSQPQVQSRQPKHWQPLPPHLHASSAPQHAGGGSHGMGQHGHRPLMPQAGSLSWSADIAAQQPSGNGRPQGRAAPDDDQRAAPQKSPKKRGEGSLPSFKHPGTKCPCLHAVAC